MPSTMQIDIVDSEKSIFSGEAEFLVAPSIAGEIGIFPHHIPIINKLKPGILRVKVPAQDEQLVFAVSGGFLEVNHNHITVLADIIERSQELDEKRLILQKEEAMKKLESSGNISSFEVAKAEAALEIAIAQLKTLDYLRKVSRKA